MKATTMTAPPINLMRLPDPVVTTEDPILMMVVVVPGRSAPGAAQESLPAWDDLANATWEDAECL